MGAVPNWVVTPVPVQHGVKGRAALWGTFFSWEVELRQEVRSGYEPHSPSLSDPLPPLLKFTETSRTLSQQFVLNKWFKGRVLNTGPCGEHSASLKAQTLLSG